MAIHLKIEANDPEVEVLLQFVKERFSTLDAYDRAEIMKRASEWLEMEKNGAPGAIPSTVRLAVLAAPVPSS